MVNLKKFRGRRKTILIGDIDRDQDSMNYRLRPNCKYVELSGILMKKETGRGGGKIVFFLWGGGGGREGGGGGGGKKKNPEKNFCFKVFCGALFPKALNIIYISFFTIHAVFSTRFFDRS